MSHKDNASHVRSLPLTNGHECADTHTKQNSTNVPILILRITQKTPVTSIQCLSMEEQTGSPPPLSCFISRSFCALMLSLALSLALPLPLTHAFFERTLKRAIHITGKNLYIVEKNRVFWKELHNPATNTGPIKHMIRIFCNVEKIRYILRRALSILKRALYILKRALKILKRARCLPRCRILQQLARVHLVWSYR